MGYARKLGREGQGPDQRKYIQGQKQPVRRRLAREKEDSILTVLGEFSNTPNPLYGGLPGPLHNQIPQPDRNVDNTTIWAPRLWSSNASPRTGAE